MTAYWIGKIEVIDEKNTLNIPEKREKPSTSTVVFV